LAARGVYSLALEPSAQVSLWEKLERMQAAWDSSAAVEIALWIGPESGWSEAELGEFATSGIEAVRLGQGVLRAETAGPVAVAVTRLVMGDW
jgi:RsmE family RNA methyltransferase